jgi:hypothetical protein
MKTKKRMAALLVMTLGMLFACSAPYKQSAGSANASPNESVCRNALTPRLPAGLYQALGEGANQVQAIDQALSTIARQVRVVIRAEALSEQAKRDGVVSQQFEKRISSVSEQVFDDYRMVCADPTSHTVVLEYDHRALPVRLGTRLQNWWGESGWQLAWAPDLAVPKSLLAVSERSGGAPLSAAVSLLHDRNGWFLQLNDQRLNVRAQEWRQLYALPNTSQGNTQLSLVNEAGIRLAHSLNPGTEFRFHLSGVEARYRYFSIFALDVQGKVLVVRSNALI